MSNSVSNTENLTQQYNDTLSQYQKIYEDYIASLNKSPSDTNHNDYNSQLKKLNQQLLDINNSIIKNLNQSISNYSEDSEKSKQQNNILNNNNNNLLAEQNKIDQLINQRTTLNQANINSELFVSAYYSKYIVLLFVTILLVMLLFKYAVIGTEQQGGSGKNFANEATFLFMLMSILLGLANAFNNINSYILFTIIVITYIVVKLKIIHNI